MLECKSLLTQKKWQKVANGRVVRKDRVLKQSHDSLTLPRRAHCTHQSPIRWATGATTKLRIMNILVKTSIPCNCLVFVADAARCHCRFYCFWHSACSHQRSLSHSLSHSVLLRCFRMTGKDTKRRGWCRTPTMALTYTAFNIIKYLLGDSEFPSKP